LTKREKLLERVHAVTGDYKDMFVFTASMTADGELVANAFFEHNDFPDDEPPRSYVVGHALIQSISAATGQTPDEGNHNVH
jgi:hypothetical protein